MTRPKKSQLQQELDILIKHGKSINAAQIKLEKRYNISMFVNNEGKIFDIKNESITKKSLRPLIESIIKEGSFDRFTMKVNQSFDKGSSYPKGQNYKGTIKRTKDGWQMFDENGSREEAGDFSDIMDLIYFYDLKKSDLSGEYVKNLRF